MPRLRRLLLVTVTSALTASGTVANAQSDDDWDLAVDAARQRTVASVEYASGVAVIAQCQGRSLQVAITGLPQAAPGGRWFDLRLANGATRRAFLTRQRDRTTLTGASPRVLRFLKGGGSLTLRAEQRGTPFQLEVELPGASGGLDAVLTACGHATTNDRDMLLSVEELLTRTPRLTMPRQVMERRAAPTFQISVSCLVAGGRYTACRSEHEEPPHPADGQITANVLNGLPIQVTDRDAAEGRILDMTVVGSRTRRGR